MCACVWLSVVMPAGACGGLLTSICQASANSWHEAAVQCKETFLSDQASSSRKLRRDVAFL